MQEPCLDGRTNLRGQQEREREGGDHRLTRTEEEAEEIHQTVVARQ